MKKLRPAPVRRTGIVRATTLLGPATLSLSRSS